MSLKDKPNAEVTDEAIAQAIYEHLDNAALSTKEKLPCAIAFAIAKAQEVSPRLVGQTADALEIRLCRCQLGFFGYPGKTGWDIPIDGGRPITEHPTPEGLEAALREAAGAKGQITCAQAWALAARFDTPKMLVGYLADQVDIHVVACQLGAF
jgi:hypothetical protein